MSERIAAQVYDRLDFIRRRYYCARRVWPIRHEKTPSGRCTWAQWFRRHFGVALNGYRHIARRGHHRSLIVAYEKLVLGGSPLEREDVNRVNHTTRTKP